MTIELKLGPIGMDVDGEQIYDVIICGGGPAGFGAAIYTSRYMLSTLVIGEMPGGQAALSSMVENYAGINALSGAELSGRFLEHAESLGVKHMMDTVTGIEKNHDIFTVKAYGGDFKCRSIIIATGSDVKKLGVPGEKEFDGRGVSYCATCDGAFYRGKVTAVVGGGDSALDSALVLSNLCEKVYLIHRRKEFRAMPSMVEKLRKQSNVTFLLDSALEEVAGENTVNSINVKNLLTGESSSIDVNGVFIEVGHVPRSEIAKSIGVELNHEGLIITGPGQETNVEGVFAAGDITTGSNGFRQIITAVSEGAIAADSTFKFLKS